MKQTGINEMLLQQIDSLSLSDRILAWRDAMRSSPWKLYAEREKYTVSSWRETMGEDIQLRRAKLLKNVLDNIEIAIHDFDVIVGRPRPASSVPVQRLMSVVTISPASGMTPTQSILR